jgi:hypothetical protein
VAALIVVLSVSMSACQATIRVGVATNADGSGTVTVTGVLDRDASRAIPDLAQELRTGDLQQAGWRIAGPKPASGGGSTVSASKDFRTPAEANQILDQISGQNGAFRLRLSRRRSFFSTSTTFAGTVDLTCGLECFGDRQLQQQLGANLGLDPAKLQQAGIAPGQIVGFEVGVHLPGSIRTTNAPTRSDGDLQWPMKLGEKGSLLATARVLDVTRVVILAAAALALVLLALVLLVRWRRRRRAGRARGSRRHRGWTPRHAASR